MLWRATGRKGRRCLGAEALPRAPAPRQVVSVPPIGVDAIAKAAGDLPRLRSLLVSWRGSVIVERYFNGARPARPANIKSASKSVNWLLKKPAT